MSDLVPTALWRITPQIVLSLAKHFGDPMDSYVNGSQVWLVGNGPNDVTLEWRMHPVVGYTKPADIETFDVFPLTALGLSDNDEIAELPAPINELWDGLEAFAAYGDDVEPQPLAEACTVALGIAPDAFGIVNHQAIADRWEKSNRAISITDALFMEIGTSL